MEITGAAHPENPANEDLEHVHPASLRSSLILLFADVEA